MTKPAVKWLIIATMIVGFSAAGGLKESMQEKRPTCRVAPHATARMRRETEFSARCSRHPLLT